MAKTYKILGAGKTSENPITVKVAYDTEYATICWVGETTDEGDGCTCVSTHEKYCEIIDISNAEECDKCDEECSPVTGTTSWEGNTVYYKIFRTTLYGTEECPSEKPGDTSCSVGNVWGVFDNENGVVNVYYEKIITTDYGDYADIKSEINSFSANTQCDKQNHTISAETGCEGEYSSITYTYKCGDSSTCESGETLYIDGVLIDPTEVPNEGGTVDSHVYCHVLTKNNDCTTEKSYYEIVYSGETIPSATTQDEKCQDKKVNVVIEVSDILSSITGIDDDVVIKYNGTILSKNSKITEYVVRKKSEDAQCDSECEYKTTYCVPKSGLTVETETSYGSNEWEKNDENHKVPATGGRVKVSWYYVINNDVIKGNCNGYTGSGNTYQIINIPACNSNSCSAFTGDIYFKTIGEDCGEDCFGTVDTGSSYSGMVDIIYSGYQETSLECEPGTIFNRIQIPISGFNSDGWPVSGDAEIKLPPVSACDTSFSLSSGTEISGVSISGTGIFKGQQFNDNCDVIDITGYTSGDVTVFFDTNETSKERIVETDYFKLTQDPGPCGGGGDECNCEIKITSGDSSEQCDELSYTYFDTELDCHSYNIFPVPYESICSGTGIVLGDGWKSVIGFISCNTGGTRQIEIQIGDKTITATQDGGCSDCEMEEQTSVDGIVMNSSTSSVIPVDGQLDVNGDGFNGDIFIFDPCVEITDITITPEMTQENKWVDLYVDYESISAVVSKNLEDNDRECKISLSAKCNDEQYESGLTIVQHKSGFFIPSLIIKDNESSYTENYSVSVDECYGDVYSFTPSINTMFEIINGNVTINDEPVGCLSGGNEYRISCDITGESEIEDTIVFYNSDNYDNQIKLSLTLYCSTGCDCDDFIINGEEAPVECPQKGMVLQVFSHEFPADGGLISGPVVFNRNNTAFTSIQSVTYDGIIITGATWGGTSPSQFPGDELVLAVSPNTSSSSRTGGTITITANRVDGDTCAYTESGFTQQNAEDGRKVKVIVHLTGNVDRAPSFSLMSGNNVMLSVGSTDGGTGTSATHTCTWVATGRTIDGLVIYGGGYTGSSWGNISIGETWNETEKTVSDNLMGINESSYGPNGYKFCANGCDAVCSTFVNNSYVGNKEIHVLFDCDS